MIRHAVPRFSFRAGVFGALSFAKLDSLLLRIEALRGATLVLNLHRVSPEDSPYWPPLHPRIFEDLLRFLTDRARVRGFDEPAGRDRRRPDVVLSFDDGYYDFVEYAMPLLARYSIRVNHNVIPHSVDGGGPPWEAGVTDALAVAPLSLLARIRLPGFVAPELSGGARSKARFGAVLTTFLKLRPRADRLRLMEELSATMVSVDVPKVRMMTREDVREAAREHDIGAHSWHHDSMGFETDAYLREDVRACRAYFQDTLGLPLDTYAFPNGSYRPSQIELLLEEGVRRVLLVGERVTGSTGSVVPRISVTGLSSSEARLVASGLRARSRMA